MKKKACRMCKSLYDGNECPIHGPVHSSTNWQGRMFILDAEKSLIAKKISIEQKGEYAIKVR